MDRRSIIDITADTLLKASTVFSEDKKKAYGDAISAAQSGNSRWAFEEILRNSEAAERSCSPLCDDTGIPHVFLEVGEDAVLTGRMLREIEEGIREGLRRLPGRPMAVTGSDVERLEQSGRLSEDPARVELAPPIIKTVPGDRIRMSVIMQGGGPAIRGITYRVFHKHSIDTLLDEICERATEGVKKLGCTPCTLAIGIGRSQYEAAALMMEAQVYGRYDEQSALEKRITDKVNEADVGPLGLGGVSVLGTFLKAGPQRASGVRIVSIRPCCCFEPRIATAEL